MPGLSAGRGQAQAWAERSRALSFSLFGSAADRIRDELVTGVQTGTLPIPIDLASPPTSFTITGNGFANLGFGLPVVNFVRNGVLIAQARATGLSGSTTLDRKSAA